MTVGTPPGTGPQLVDGIWLQGLANGQNLSSQNALTAKASGTQSNGTPIPTNTCLVEFDTVATTGDSAVLPFADLLGVEFAVINNGAATLDVYSNPGTNPATATADSLNGSTSAAFTISSKSVSWFVCAKLGVWMAK